jgi:uncharacterized protein with FMN-binding domain
MPPKRTMKKYLLSFFLIIAFAFYIVLNNESQGEIMMAPNNPSTSDMGGLGLGTSTLPASTTTATSTGNATSTASGLYKDGTYTGDVANAIYGQLKVIAVVTGGKLTDVQVPLYPDDPGHSSLVSATALPKLKQEALQIQGAQVNIVSGATQTSEAFQESLGNALAQAKA